MAIRGAEKVASMREARGLGAREGRRVDALGGNRPTSLELGEEDQHIPWYRNPCLMQKMAAVEVCLRQLLTLVKEEQSQEAFWKHMRDWRGPGVEHGDPLGWAELRREQWKKAAEYASVSSPPRNHYLNE